MSTLACYELRSLACLLQSRAGARARAPRSTELRPGPPLQLTFYPSSCPLSRPVSHIRCLGVEDLVAIASLLRICDPSHYLSCIAPFPHHEYLNALSTLKSRGCAALPTSPGPTKHRPQPLRPIHCWPVQTQIIATTPLLTMGNA